MHNCEDHFLPEIIDPETARCFPTDRRRAGFHYHTKEGIPVIRYRTRDLTI
jgi:phenylacetate-CoA ligase